MTTEGSWYLPDGTYFWEGTEAGTPQNSAYNNWRVNDQPNASSTSQDCAGMSTTNSGGWGDYAISDVNPALCEGPGTSASEYNNWASLEPNDSLDMPCPAGTTLDAATDTCWKVTTAATDFDTARAECQALGTGADLVNIDTAAVNTYALAQRPAGDFWIGASDQESGATEGTWERTDGTQIIVSGVEVGAEYNNWLAGQPSTPPACPVGTALDATRAQSGVPPEAVSLAEVLAALSGRSPDEETPVAAAEALTALRS